MLTRCDQSGREESDAQGVLAEEDHAGHFKHISRGLRSFGTPTATVTHFVMRCEVSLFVFS